MNLFFKTRRSCELGTQEAEQAKLRVGTCSFCSPQIILLGAVSCDVIHCIMLSGCRSKSRIQAAHYYSCLLLQFLYQLWYDFEEIVDEAYVCDLEDRGIRVLQGDVSLESHNRLQTNVLTLLTATMSFESFMPAKCWIAPEMPNAMYSSGATTFPVCPTCSELSA